MQCLGKTAFKHGVQIEGRAAQCDHLAAAQCIAWITSSILYQVEHAVLVNNSSYAGRACLGLGVTLNLNVQVILHCAITSWE